MGCTLYFFVISLKTEIKFIDFVEKSWIKRKFIKRWERNFRH